MHFKVARGVLVCLPVLRGISFKTKVTVETSWLFPNHNKGPYVENEENMGRNKIQHNKQSIVHNQPVEQLEHETEEKDSEGSPGYSDGQNDGDREVASHVDGRDKHQHGAVENTREEGRDTGSVGKEDVQACPCFRATRSPKSGWVLGKKNKS